MDLSKPGILHQHLAERLDDQNPQTNTIRKATTAKEPNNISSPLSGTAPSSRRQCRILKHFLGLRKARRFSSEGIILRLKWDNACRSVPFTTWSCTKQKLGSTKNPFRLFLSSQRFSRKHSISCFLAESFCFYIKNRMNYVEWWGRPILQTRGYFSHLSLRSESIGVILFQLVAIKL